MNLNYLLIERQVFGCLRLSYRDKLGCIKKSLFIQVSIMIGFFNGWSELIKDFKQGKNFTITFTTNKKFGYCHMLSYSRSRSNSTHAALHILPEIQATIGMTN